jgi:alpha-glucoside transport system substrate-binding protein
LTQFDESVIQVAATGEGVMLQGSEFVQALTGGVLAEGALHEAQEPLGSFPFPSPTPVQPVILGGDVAVVMTGSGRGEDLVSWLAQPGSFTSWIEAGGYLSPVLNAAGDYPDPTGDYAPLVAQPGADAQFDLSDQLGGEVARRIGPELQSLFSAVAFGSVSGGHEASALRTAREGASRLNEAAGGHAC